MKYNKIKNMHINKNGFTLIELMVVLVILSLITIGLVTFFGGGIRSWISGQYQLQAQREARMMLDQMVKKIREADKIDETSDENTVIVDYNVIPGDSVTYSWSGNSGDSLTQKIGSGPSSAFLDNVHNFSLIYLNQSGIIMTDESNASKIIIDLQLDLDGDVATGGSPDISLNTEVNLRNYRN